ncbi:MAG: PAS domain S-box protein [Rhodospirillaceae bacterium]|nr:PAS domain S-box protein [Rhodospirillaceae bacterium]
MKKISLRYRLLAGFTFIVILLAISVSSTLVLVKSTKEHSSRVISLRVPTALAGSDMSRDIYASLAALRGWMLTGDEIFKTQRTQVWQSIHKTSAKIDTLSENWTNPENVKSWKKFKIILSQFSSAQDLTEKIAHSSAQYPATNILLTHVAPLAAKMVKQITLIIDLEISEHPAEGENHLQLLGMMTDVRGSLGLMLASIRAHLLTGEEKFVAEFNDYWTQNNKRFTDLSNSEKQLSPSQKLQFEKFKISRMQFKPLPAKMLEIRSSKKWDMASYLLVTEAIPHADTLLNILLGDINEDGEKTHGMVGNQRELLIEDSQTEAQLVDDLYNLQWMLLVVGVLFGAVFALLASRAFTAPILSLANTMLHLASGKLDTKITDEDRGDEIGEMIKAVQVFKKNAIERERIERRQRETRRELDFQKYALDEHAIVSISNVQGNIIYVNDKFCDVSGFSKEELIGKNHRIVKSDGHRPKFFKDLWGAISNGEVWHGELKNKAKDGHYYWVMTTIVPTLNANGKPFQYVSIRTDVTARKEAELKAITASRTKSDLMANMSHELRTPLNAIIGFSGFMKDEMFGSVGSDKNREYIEDINSSGQHLLELINDILDVSAIEADGLELQESDVDVERIVNSTVRLIKPRAKTGEITITSSIDENVPHIYADERRIKQVLLNLLSNAVKFTPQGGEVSVDANINDDGSFSFLISDSGIGMDEEEAAVALSAFGQVDSGLDRKHEGTGLGLPLTKGLMELHGGTLKIKSKKGHGTTVSATFPEGRVIKNI